MARRRGYVRQWLKAGGFGKAHELAEPSTTSLATVCGVEVTAVERRTFVDAAEVDAGRVPVCGSCARGRRNPGAA